MRLYYAGTSDIGCVRTNNEDYVYSGRLTTGDFLFVVADGMGGHHAGEVASRRAVTQLVRAVEDGLPEPIHDSLGALFKKINQDLFDENQKSERDQRMGTTLSALLARDDRAYLAHVGDSRIYRYRHDLTSDGQHRLLTRMTDDHSFVGALVRDGTISEAEARVHPKRSVLTQAIGMRGEIVVQIRGPLEVRPGDKYLLCSDGLSSVVADSEIQEFFAVPSNEQITTKLINRVKSLGGPDNISVIVVSTEPGPAPASQDDTSPEIDLPSNPGTFNPGKPMIKRRLGHRRFLLCLLALLLAAIVYMLVDSASRYPSQPATTTTKAPMVPKGN